MQTDKKLTKRGAKPGPTIEILRCAQNDSLTRGAKPACRNADKPHANTIAMLKRT